jgi:SAM-dependent methyltransferase
MRRPEDWKPTKFVTTTSGLRATRDVQELTLSSRLSADLVAPHYERMLRDHAHGRLLDLGAGSVPLYGVYRDLVNSVTCVDWPDTLHPSPHVDHFCDLNQPLSLPDAAFDTVVLTDVLEHIARPEVLWPEMRRVLAPGGRLLLATPFLYWIHEAPHDYARYTEHMLRRFCTEQGFRVVELTATGGSPEVLCDLVARHLAWSSIIGRLFQATARAVLTLRPVRRLSSRSSQWFPLGYILVAQA